jgi:hypothetical protein
MPDNTDNKSSRIGDGFGLINSSLKWRVALSRLYYPPPPPAGLAAGESAPLDIKDLAKKVAQIIPAELVTGYTALISFSMNVRWGRVRPWCFLLSFVLCWALTPYYLNKMADPGKPKRNHLIISTIAFAIWAYFVSGQQVIPQCYDTGIASMLLVVFSLLTAAVPLTK